MILGVVLFFDGGLLAVGNVRNEMDVLVALVLTT